MGANGLDEYWVPEHVKDYLRKLGFVLPWMTWSPGSVRGMTGWARGGFYDYRGYVATYKTETRTVWGACMRCTGEPFTLRCAFARSGVLFSSMRKSRLSARTRRPLTGSTCSSRPLTS